MSATKDVSSVTNSVMQAIDKELRKNGLAPAGHRHYQGNRKIIEAMIGIMVLETQAAREAQKNENDTRS